ncbi:MAG: NRDE family protein, partial [Myxococcota bacterium]|nr:NRDE family protein [Myxococcota bacterium]
MRFVVESHPWEVSLEMCTVIIMSRMWPESPLLIAANRDEFYGRPASPPRLQSVPGSAVIAPVDLKAGGT